MSRRSGETKKDYEWRLQREQAEEDERRQQRIRIAAEGIEEAVAYLLAQNLEVACTKEPVEGGNRIRISLTFAGRDIFSDYFNI